MWELPPSHNWPFDPFPNSFVALHPNVNNGSKAVVNWRETMFNRWDTTLICLTKYHFRHFKHKLQKEYSVPLTAGHCHHIHAPDLSEETITYPNDHLHFFGFKYIKMVSALPIHIWVASSNNSHNIVDSYLHRPIDTHESKSKHSWFSSTFSSDTWSICVQQWKSEQWHTNALNFVVRGQSGVQLCLLKKQ